MVVKVYQRSNVEGVEQLLRLAIRLNRFNSLLPGPLRTIKVSQTPDTGKYQVEWVMSKRSDIDVEELITPDVWNEQFVNVNAYKKSQVLYEETAKIPQISVQEGQSLLLSRRLVVKLYNCCDEISMNNCIKEALLQIHVESRFACKLLDFCIKKGEKSKWEVGLIMERLEKDLGADIRERALQNSFYTEEELVQILLDISDALMYAKWLGVAHRDIKPPNIFIDNGHYRLGDFGSACEVEELDNLPDGTPKYLSPEMRYNLLGEEKTIEAYQSDVFSLGMTLLHLAKLKFPESLPGAWRSSIKLMTAVEKEVEGLPYSSVFFDLIKQMLSMNPNCRPVFEEIHLKLLIHSQKIAGILPNWIERELNESSGIVDEHIISQKVQQVYKLIDDRKFLEAKIVLLNMRSKNKAKGFNIPCGYLYLMQGRYLESEKLLYSSLPMPFDSTIDIFNNIAMGYIFENKHLEARILLKQKRLMLSENINPAIIQISNCIGLTYLIEEKYDESEVIFEHNLNRCKEEFGKESQLYLNILWGLAGLYIMTGRTILAETVILESIEIKKKLSVELLPNIAYYYTFLGWVLCEQGKHEEAERVLLQTLEQFTPLLGATHTCIFTCSNLLISVYIEAQKWLEVAKIYRNYLDFNLKLRQDSKEVILTFICQALCHQRENRLSEAEQCATKAISISVRLYGEEYILTILGFISLGGAICSQGRFDEAIVLFEKVLPILKKIQGENINYAYCANLLGLLYLKQARHFDAEKLHEKCLEIFLELLGETDPNTLAILIQLVENYLIVGKLREADSLLQVMFSIHMDHYLPDSSNLSKFSHDLIVTYFRLERKSEAILFTIKYLQFCTICNPNDPLLDQLPDVLLISRVV